MSIKVLVADDSITIQKVIGIIFGGDEYSLTVVDNGKSAVDKAREIDPDILLIDALMPGMTGYEVTELIRSTPSLAVKPILILTGSFEPFDEEKAKKCGADDFIAKPFESQQIITKVKELLELGRSRALTAQAMRPQAVSEPLREQTPESSSPVFNIPTPVFAPQPEISQPAAPADIWGAFTTEVDVPVKIAETPVDVTPFSATFEPDVFSIITEENEEPPGQMFVTAAPSPHQTGSQWIPVEENTFEFEEEIIADAPQSIFTEQTVLRNEASFGDIVFDDDIALPTALTKEEPPFAEPEPVVVPEPEPMEEVAVPETILPTVTLTEDQLRAAITSASKEVIERIVWEVVPDLAEAMIREAIRKIKEGV